MQLIINYPGDGEQTNLLNIKDFMSEKSSDNNEDIYRQAMEAKRLSREAGSDPYSVWR